MGICKPYLYDASDKYAPPKLPPHKCRAECPYGRDLLPIPPKKQCDQPIPVTSGAFRKEPLISYKTSTGRALVYKVIPQFVVNFDRAPLPRILLKRDPELLTETYKTTYGTNYANKYSLDTSRLNAKPPRGGRGMAIKIYANRVSAHPPRPMTVFNSTMRDAYPPHSVHDTRGMVVPSIKEISECKLNRVGLDCEAPFPREEGGYVTELDFALPTAAKDFRRFRPDELNVDAPLTIYTETGAYKPNVGLAPMVTGCRPVHGPIWDEVRMRKRVPNTYVPHRLPLVPHRGMCSETREKYQHVTDEFYIQSLFPLVKYPVTLYPYKSEEVFLSPGMYMPESAHYGSRIPVSTFVDIAKNKEDNNIQFCTMKKKTPSKRTV